MKGFNKHMYNGKRTRVLYKFKKPRLASGSRQKFYLKISKHKPRSTVCGTQGRHDNCVSFFGDKYQKERECLEDLKVDVRRL
jgi:hypothetical protein